MYTKHTKHLCRARRGRRLQRAIAAAPKGRIVTVTDVRHNAMDLQTDATYARRADAPGTYYLHLPAGIHSSLMLPDRDLRAVAKDGGAHYA